MSHHISIKNEILRKLVHLSSLWMVLFIFIFEQEISILFFSILLVLFTLFEYSRMESNLVKTFMNRYFSAIMRENEITTGFKISGLTGSFYFLLSVVLSLIFFDKAVAMIAISIMILSDTVAALIGKKFGTMRIWDKSLEGAGAFFITTLAILVFFIPMLPVIVAIIISIIITAVEFVSNHFRVNDNLSITLIAGCLVQISSGIFL